MKRFSVSIEHKTDFKKRWTIEVDTDSQVDARNWGIIQAKQKGLTMDNTKITVKEIVPDVQVEE